MIFFLDDSHDMDIPAGKLLVGLLKPFNLSEVNISGDDNQAVIWTNAVIYKFSLEKRHLNMVSAKWRPFCLDLSDLHGFKANTPCVYWQYSGRFGL